MMPFQKAFLNSPDIGRLLELPDCAVHYHEQGAGPGIVLLHGLGFSLYTYRLIIPPLSQQFRVISVDLPGCGYSRGVPGSGSVEDMCGALHRFIQAVSGGKPVSLLGTAEGAVYAMELALRHPETVSALILESPGSLTRFYPWQWQQLLTPLLGEYLIGRMKETDLERILRGLHFDETLIGEYEVHQTYQPFRDRETGRNMLTLLRNFDSRKTLSQMKRLGCPVCLLWGGNDGFHPPSMSRLYTRSIGRCRCRQLRNCGHLAHEERPSEFAETATEFLLESLPRQWDL